MSYVDQLLGQNEKVVLVAHQSWVVLVREAIINLIIAVIIIALTLVVIGGTFIATPLAWLILLALLLPAGRFVWQYIQWSNREYIVTNRRVIQVEGTVNKNVIDSSIEKVNDVRLSQSVLGRFFNYGDVEILTASSQGINLFQRIKDPIKFKTAMLDEKDKLGFDEVAAGPVGSSPEPSPKDIPTMIASLSALRSQGLITEEEFQKKKAELLARM